MLLEQARAATRWSIRASSPATFSVGILSGTISA